MANTAIEEVPASLSPLRAGTAPRPAAVQPSYDRDTELEACDFIARCVLEKDAEFFDG
jgi:hypothetical protein